MTNRRLLEGAPVPSHTQETAIIPPVYINPTAKVRCSVIGPYVSIGPGAQVNSVIARNMLIGAQAVVENILLEDTLIGFQAVVKGRASRMNVGDLSEIIS